MDNVSIPIYRQIVDDIKARIDARDLNDGDALPTQSELAKMYDASEITSRRALGELVQAGLVVRVRGKGSFVRIARPETEAGKTQPEPGPVKRVVIVHPTFPPHYFNHPFYSGLIEGVSRVTGASGTEQTVWDCGQNISVPVDSATGMIILPGAPTAEFISTEQLSKWKQTDARMILVHFYFPQLQIPYVVVDNTSGGYLATEHLLSLGHRRIGIIVTGHSRYEMNQEFSFRLQGYHLAHSQHELRVDEQLVSVMDAQEEYVESGYLGARQLLSLPDPPTAIFATSDYKALGVMRAARDLGLRIPEDLAIVGYDNVVYGQYCNPTLTTIDQNTIEVGDRAARMLLSGTDKPQQAKAEILPQLIVRESSRTKEAP
jgi:DNA-binding LacI/PurR family transcriptional regulator